ncbi:vitamin K epoxide reductase family protein [Nocardioides marmoriginsengisoli]|uniref:Vitamin K epoxide reductase family protein n=1 Tax=Nocardioides marmoriginsengisoli TaxID=661483 RepID=A0A3N0CNG8_9ACTN|nr:vitamin K epoxide reductase family protein [Nocardioides marmoriginsengisoli]RNL64889.1 vitamin K epoxide reductase family protein [Nocardioides marmoriginsengisoli]
MRSTPRALAWLLVLGGTVGAAAAVTLMLEKLAVLRDPGYVPSCNLSPVINCGSIMSSDQAEAFGFPNPLIGIAAFPVLIATGAALLAGARLARWYWLGLQVGVVAGTAFIGWLAFQSLYRIEALCPYCLAVWAVVVPIAWYVTLENLWAGRFGTRAASSKIARWLRQSHALIPMFALLVVVGLVIEQFWSYWTTVI